MLLIGIDDGPHEFVSNHIALREINGRDPRNIFQGLQRFDQSLGGAAA